TLNGWKCNAVLPVQSTQTTSYYFKCLDQPWLGSINTERNPATQSAEYVLEKNTSALEIYDITPNEVTLSFGSVPATTNLIIKTQGGINNNALCEYNGVPFFETGGQIHKNTFDQLVEGSYTFNLVCTDSANNIAT